MCTAAAIITGNGTALWIITPIAALSVAALVMGYEHRATEQRLGPRRNHARLSLTDTDDTAPLATRFSCWFTILLPWLILYEAIGHLPTPSTLASIWRLNAAHPSCLDRSNLRVCLSAGPGRPAARRPLTRSASLPDRRNRRDGHRLLVLPHDPRAQSTARV